MILYFDNYITDTGLTPGAPVWAEEIRKGPAPVYHMPSKFDITMYTLASYAVLDWSAVVIKYDIEDKARAAYFESEVMKLFPKAMIIRGRSDSQAKFQESVKLMRKLGDEWVFYAGNNDHPFVGKDKEVLDHCLQKAAELKKTHKFVSIKLSQMLEGLGAPDPSSLMHDKRWKLLGEDEKCLWARVNGGFFDAIQIVHIDLLEHWFCSKEIPSNMRMRFFRSDTVENFVRIPDHMIVVPKNEICSHFDGYSHLESHGFQKPDEMSPPLLIPPGFFEGKIRIAYGYDNYREGWLNLNPSKKLYCFQGKDGTDLKLSLGDLPLFWKSRIEKTDVNPSADLEALDKAYLHELDGRKAAWKSSPVAAMKKAKNKVTWIATQGARRWKKRVEIWSEKPESLERVLDECEPSTEGKIKAAAKKIIYHSIVAARKASGTVEASFHLRQMKTKRKLSERAIWLAKTPVYAARAAVNFTKYSVQKPHTFAFLGREYGCFYHPYNKTWENERCVEVPIVWAEMQNAKGKRILEIGNVLSHYYDAKHDILDKYEVDEGVINADIVGFAPEKKYDLVVSISTLEHVGWDEKPREPEKIFAAFSSVEGLCAEGGKAIVTLPLGSNPNADSIARKDRLPGWKWRFLRRAGESEWKEVGAAETGDAVYNKPYPGANCLAVGIFQKGQGKQSGRKQR